MMVVMDRRAFSLIASAMLVWVERCVVPVT